MKRLFLLPAALMLILAAPTLRAADESAQQLATQDGLTSSPDGNEESAAALAAQDGLNPGTTDTEESAQQLATDDGDAIKPAPDESAAQLAGDEGLNPGTKDNEESAAALAEGDKLESKPKATSAPTSSVFAEGEGVDGTIYAVVAQPDNKVVIGGRFNNVNGQPRANLARLNPDGTLDASFAQSEENGVDGTVYALAIDAKGNILVGGYFSQPQNSELKNFLRYTPDGKIDQTFDAGQTPNGPVYAIAVQPDGMVVIGGEFTEVGSVERRNIARFNPDTTLNGGLNYESSGTIRALAVLPDGAVTAGGSFEVSSSTVRNILKTPAN